jgi:hypothetical protein
LFLQEQIKGITIINKQQQKKRVAFDYKLIRQIVVSRQLNWLKSWKLNKVYSRLRGADILHQDKGVINIHTNILRTSQGVTDPVNTDVSQTVSVIRLTPKEVAWEWYWGYIKPRVMLHLAYSLSVWLKAKYALPQRCSTD